MFNHSSYARVDHIAAILANALACLASLAFTHAAHGAITPTGDVNPIHDGSDPWNLEDNTMFVGDATTGLLQLTDGSIVYSYVSFVGYGTGAYGTITVNGIGSELSNFGTLYLGSLGNGVLNVEAGGRVSNTEGLLGTREDASSIATVTVTGIGSVWHNALRMLVGYRGTGTLNVENGGTVNNRGGFIGMNKGSIGTVNVNGNGSTLNNTELKVGGYRGTGTLNIENGGMVNSSDGVVGYSDGSIGTANVTGPGSSWNSTGNLSISLSGGGTLNVNNGGTVNNDTGFIGISEDSFGTVTVMGVGSVWDNSESLYVGLSGAGILNIENEGLVRVNYSLGIAQSSGSTGTLNLSGGTLDLNGANITAGEGIASFNFTSGMIKNAAVVELNQPLIQQGGTIAPGGSIGQTDIIGDYTLAAGAVEIEVGGAGYTHDLLTATGDIDLALLGTTLDLSAIGAMVAGTYTVIESTGGTLTGMFEHVAGLAMYAGLVDVSYTSDAVMVTLNWDYLPGDLNGDGFVGIEDLASVLVTWNQTVAPGDLLSGDVNGDGFVGIEDLNVVLGNWNTVMPPPADVLGAVPEPGTLGLLGCGLLACCVRKSVSNC